MLGASCQSPNWLTAGSGDTCLWDADFSDAAEVDIAEDTGSNETTYVGENVSDSSGVGNHVCRYDTGSDLSTAYHDYELDWTSAGMTFKVDGKATGCGISSGFPIRPMFLIIDTALCSQGSSCGGSLDASTLPQTTSSAWVHVSH